MSLNGSYTSFLWLIITESIGHVLSWGQMSLWEAIAIKTLVLAIPKIHGYIVTWLQGEFLVKIENLNRSFSVHYLLPSILVAVSLIYIVLLHRDGSNNPLRIESTYDK